MEIENDLIMLEKYNLTIEEWFVTKLLILASIEEGHSEYLFRYLQLPNINNLRNILINLQNKSVILKSYKIPEKGQKFNPEDIDLNSNFLKNFYKCSGEMGEELFLSYPAYIDSGAKRFILNNITKGYNSLEEMYYDYGRIIKFNPAKHKEIMELLQFAKENNMISYGICEFIKSHKWITIKQMKDDGSYLDGVTFDNITSI